MAAVAVAKARKWSETAMLVIDMQKEFILPGRRLHVPGSSSIVPSVITAVSTARDRGIPVIWVVREHDPYGRDVEFFRRHLYEDGNGPIRKGSDGVDLVDGLSVEDGEYRLVKTRFSAFFETHLNTVLHSIGIKNLVIVGVQTPNCIRQTVFDAVSLDYQQITVITDATAAATLEIHNANILDMKNVGVVAVELQDWIDLQN
ncbi:Peroxyureidoacrylate/ureidoacrylate amidohydrolase RutB [Zostera marina]|uniref:Peroxyureidoacrylate/ureidoacrylate amidohydrolase RutB n=1 Tax=Zostera marina TaxID=29655 RepID=A0A0K9P4G6_ZOSMR|nr:Peroxyureidoacrylate/ureidoacrylate amidohydrolase RutB [Zostera marina]